MSLIVNHKLIGQARQQVEFISAGSGANSGLGVSSTVSPSYPAVIIPGSLLLIVCTDRASNSYTFSDGFSVYGDFTGVNRCVSIGYKIADGSESGTVTGSSGIATSNVKLGRIFQFRNTSMPPESIGQTESAGTATQSSLTSTKTLSLAVSFIFSYSFVSIGTYTGATGGTWSEPIAEYGVSFGNASTIGMNVATLPAIGTISGGSMSVANNLTVNFVLNP